MINPPSRELAMTFLDYNPDTGLFHWKKSGGSRAVVGRLAGNFDPSNGYCKIGICGQQLYAHRLAWLFIHGEMPSLQVDHIDGNRMNNAISNLRLANQSEQNQNQRTGRATRKDRPLGAYFRKDSGKWMSQITIDGKVIRLGLYATESEAAAAYLVAKKQVHPFQTIAS